MNPEFASKINTIMDEFCFARSDKQRERMDTLLWSMLDDEVNRVLYRLDNRLLKKNETKENKS